VRERSFSDGAITPPSPVQRGGSAPPVLAGLDSTCRTTSCTASSQVSLRDFGRVPGVAASSSAASRNGTRARDKFVSACNPLLGTLRQVASLWEDTAEDAEGYQSVAGYPGGLFV